MADVDLERKHHHGRTWIWWVVAIVVLGGGAAAYFWGWQGGKKKAAMPTAPAAVPAPAPAPAPPTGTVSPNVSFSQITANPQAYIGRTFPAMNVQVASVETPRTFWIEKNGDRLFAIVAEQQPPPKAMPTIAAGDTLRITGGTLRGPSYIPSISGAPLSQKALTTAQAQNIFLVVNQSDVQVLKPGTPTPGTQQGMQGKPGY